MLSCPILLWHNVWTAIGIGNPTLGAIHRIRDCISALTAHGAGPCKLMHWLGHCVLTKIGTAPTTLREGCIAMIMEWGVLCIWLCSWTWYEDLEVKSEHDSQ